MIDSPLARNASATWLAGGGEMGERMRALDWSQTPLGPVEGWPQSLRSPVSMLLPSKAPIILFWGPEFAVLYNDAYRAVFGAKHPRMLGQPGRIAWSEIWDVGANLRGVLDGVVRSGEAFHARDTLLDFSYTPVRDESGAVGGVFCIVTETTSRMLGERNEFDEPTPVAAELVMDDNTDMRRYMARLLQERELLLASERRAKLDAEAANRAKDEFLAMLSHELRNPLAPISTAIQLMRLRGAPIPELGTLERQTAHLTRLVDDLLDISRITRGKIELRKRTVEIGDALVRAMEMAGPLLEPRAHRVNIEAVPRRGLAVHGDPERLAQAVFNLLSNAAKYSEARSSITVRAWRDTDRVRLSVKDEGVGIAPEMIDSVFDMFVQQRQTIERSQGGLGLGLTIVRSLVELHGGRVTAKSPGAGRGSEFMIDLPGAPVVLPLPHAADRPLRPDTGPMQRLLVVDDNVDAATALAELLRLLGHQVEVAHDGLRALSVAARFRPAIALIDIGLPVMDGYQLAQRLREEHPELRLIAVTGYGRDRDRERSAQAGFTDHLVKPIELATLAPLFAIPSPVTAARLGGDERPAI